MQINVDVLTAKCQRCRREEPVQPTQLRRATDGTWKVAAQERPPGWTAGSAPPHVAEQGLCKDCTAEFERFQKGETPAAPTAPSVNEREQALAEREAAHARQVAADKRYSAPAVKAEPVTEQKNPLPAPPPVVPGAAVRTTPNGAVIVPAPASRVTQSAIPAVPSSQRVVVQQTMPIQRPGWQAPAPPVTPAVRVEGPSVKEESKVVKG